MSLTPLLEQGSNMLGGPLRCSGRTLKLDESRISNPKSRNFKLDWQTYAARQSNLRFRDFGFEILDSSNFKVPLLRSVKYIAALEQEGCPTASGLAAGVVDQETPRPLSWSPFSCYGTIHGDVFPLSTRHCRPCRIVPDSALPATSSGSGSYVPGSCRAKAHGG